MHSFFVYNIPVQSLIRSTLLFSNDHKFCFPFFQIPSFVCPCSSDNILTVFPSITLHYFVIHVPLALAVFLILEINYLSSCTSCYFLDPYASFSSLHNFLHFFSIRFFLISFLSKVSYYLFKCIR